MLSLFEIVHALFLAYLEMFDSKNRRDGDENDPGRGS